jgi:hypothetical protein
MRNFFILYFLYIIFAPANLLAQQTPKYIYNDDYPDIGYLEYLPPGYGSSEEVYPVIIFLHGGGEGGYGTPEELEKVLTWGPPSHIRNGHDMCFTVNSKIECFIVISPQLIPELYSWEPYYVDRVIDHVLNGPDEYRADPNRIYLTGLSRGGNGVYLYASSHLNNPNKLAAIAPVAAWADQYVSGCKISERKIPVWAFHGVKDTVVPFTSGLSAFNAIKDCNSPEPSAELIFTAYEDRYHDSWIPAYDPFSFYHTPNLYEWMLLQTREPEIVAGISDISKDKNVAFNIHPNPAREILNFSYSFLPGNSGAINILNLTGEVVLGTDRLQSQLDISQLSDGIYIVQLLENRTIVASRRLIKMR